MTRPPVSEQGAFVVRGHYCPTDVNPTEGARDEITEVTVDTIEDAENWLLWYPGGEIIIPAREDAGSVL